MNRMTTWILAITFGIAAWLMTRNEPPTSTP